MSSCRLWCCFSSQAADGAAAADRVPEVQVVTVAERVDATDGRALATSAKDSKQTVHAPRQSEPEPKPEFVVVPSLEVAGHPQYKKFGAVFAVVAEALWCVVCCRAVLSWLCILRSTISLDIVGMIASFLRFSPPSHATQPVFVRQFGSAKNAEFESVYAIAEAPNLEHMWVSAGGCVRIITKQGHFVSRVDGRFAEPHQIAFDSNGEVFVADWMRSLVQVCSLQGQHLRELAKYYDDEFERTSDRRFLDSPGGVAVDGKGRVAVAGAAFGVSLFHVQLLRFTFVNRGQQPSCAYFDATWRDGVSGWRLRDRAIAAALPARSRDQPEQRTVCG